MSINFTTEDRGTVIDGVHGQAYADVTIVRMAQNHGFEPFPEMGADRIGPNGMLVAGPSWGDLTYEEQAEHDQLGAVAEEALGYLNDNACEDGVLLEWIDGDLCCVGGRQMHEWEASEAFEEWINETNDVVTICGYDYDPGRALRKIDPTAFRCGMLDWCDAEGIELL